MGYGLARVIMNEIDLSQYVDTLLQGISCAAGITEKGPIGKPQLVSSEAMFERIFGGNLKNSDFPLIAKRALSYGATLWVSRVAHYADVTDKTTLTAKCSTATLKDSMARPTLKVTASSPGT